jgi:hypothetical protein
MTYMKRGSMADVPDGNWMDPQYWERQQCQQQATATLAPLRDKIDDLSNNWNTTGFYTPDELLSGVTTVMAAVVKAQGTIDQVLADLTTAGDDLHAAADSLFAVGQRSLDYTHAAQQAQQSGIRLVNAPGFKQWVITSLQTGADAMQTASVAACLNPWWLSALSAFQSGFEVAWTAVKAIGATALLVGEDVLKVAASLPELYDKYKWVGLAAIGALIAFKFLKPKG